MTFKGRRRAVSETLNRAVVPASGNQSPLSPLLGFGLSNVDRLTFNTTPSQEIGLVTKSRSSPALLTEIVKRLPLSVKSDPNDPTVANFIKQIASEGLIMDKIANLPSPVFKMSGNPSSPSADFATTPPVLFQISPKSLSDLVAFQSSPKSDKSSSYSPKQTPPRKLTPPDSRSDIRKLSTDYSPHVTTCKGAKVTRGFGENIILQPKDGTNQLVESPIRGAFTNVDSPIGPISFRPPELPEETLMPSEHVLAIQMIESKVSYAECVSTLPQITNQLWTDCSDLFMKYFSGSNKDVLESLMPNNRTKALFEGTITAETLRVVMDGIMFARKEFNCNRLRPTKAMKSGKAVD